MFMQAMQILLTFIFNTSLAFGQTKTFLYLVRFWTVELLDEVKESVGFPHKNHIAAQTIPFDWNGHTKTPQVHKHGQTTWSCTI